ncbi:hypothetical protein AR9_g090 [Bacillus phage AR9]|uniref:Uncharacterized protein n=2 Tax=Bacillus phage PBS1 TaxID=10683 RepID=A0A172JHZ4_BPPB1|nr:hypothetical protein BI022_gp089 [Bacillus phage AR9]YP_009664486.1 hypothetical protein FK780_gp162 [Bacillus phage PBS1]AMS01174.1 hypothetical protein AR9_g090 [Bacillus phage AR9]ASU00107.1 hypothetical protein PBI_PBS1_285 [Bacillus phage PBS1]BDE75384.1 hypothetical protein [Bacillus phage PBS1]
MGVNEIEKEIRWVADNTIFTHFTFGIRNFKKILEAVLIKLDGQYDTKLVQDITREIYNEQI